MQAHHTPKSTRLAYSDVCALCAFERACRPDVARMPEKCPLMQETRSETTLAPDGPRIEPQCP